MKLANVVRIMLRLVLKFRLAVCMEQAGRGRYTGKCVDLCWVEGEGASAPLPHPLYLPLWMNWNDSWPCKHDCMLVYRKHIA